MSEHNKESLSLIEQELLKTDWKEEAEKVPLENLEIDEVIVLKKCIKEQDMTNEEVALLKEILQSYRNVLKENNIENAEENIKHSKELIKTEQSVLEMINKFQKQRFVLNLPLGDETIELEFDIKPIKDSSKFKDLASQIGIFDDFTEREKKTLQKSFANHPMNKREKAIADGLMDRYNQYLQDNDDEITTEILANQLLMVSEGKNESTLETRRTFWKEMPSDIRNGVFQNVKDMVGLTDSNNRKMFYFR